MLHEAIISPYVDFEYYSKTFLGKKIGESDFPVHEKRAEAVLDQITFNRVRAFTEIPDCVKDAVCAMAETHYQEDKKTPGIKSETTDGYSVSFDDKGSSEKMAENGKIYLADTGLLFKGRSKQYDN